MRLSIPLISTSDFFCIGDLIPRFLELLVPFQSEQPLHEICRRNGISNNQFQELLLVRLTVKLHSSGLFLCLHVLLRSTMVH